jgi:hypothetical protein
VLTIHDDFVVAYYGLMSEVVEKYPFLLHPRQVHGLKAVVNVCPVMPHYQKDVMPKMLEVDIFYVFLVASGPQVENVQAFEGQVGTAESTICLSVGTYCLCQRPKSSKKVEVPESIRMLFLRRTFVPAVRYDLTDEQYYKTSFTEYSSWSYGVHQKQVEQVFKYISKEAQIVAPGDGIGVCFRLWQGKKKSNIGRFSGSS